MLRFLSGKWNIYFLWKFCTGQQGRHKIVFRALEAVSDCEWEKQGRGRFAYWKIWQRLFSGYDFRIHQAIEGMWFSHGWDFVGVLYAGGNIGKEVEDR